MFAVDESLKAVTVLWQDQERALAAHAPTLERLLLAAIESVNELTEILRSK